MGWPVRGHFMCAALVVMVSAFPSAGMAQDSYVPLAVDWEVNANEVVATFDVRSAFTEEFRAKINGGLTERAEIEIRILDRFETEIVRTSRRCEFTLDVWDDVLTVRVIEENRRRRRKFQLIDDGLAHCGGARRIPVGNRSLYRHQGGYRVVVTVSLNPVSDAEKQAAREFTSNPRGYPAKPRGFLSSVAEFFSASAEVSGDTFYFRSPSLGLPVKRVDQ